MSLVRSQPPFSKKRRLESQLARYALAAGSALAASTVALPADAAIEYTTAFGPGLSPIDLNRDGRPDFFFSTIGGNSFLFANTFSDTIGPTIIGGGFADTIGGGNLGFILNTIGGIVGNTTGNTVGGTVGGTIGGTIGGFADTISAGSGGIGNTIGGIVGGTSTHLATVLNAGFTVGPSPSLTYFQSASVDPFATHDGFAGVHFDVVTRTPILAFGGFGPTEIISNGQFGWFQFGGGQAVLAAADTSGSPIMTAVPEPSILELMALGAAGLAALRVRRRRPE
jgi:hypothetical protein